LPSGRGKRTSTLMASERMQRPSSGDGPRGRVMAAGLRLWKRPLALAISLVAAWVLWRGVAEAREVLLLGFVAILIAAVFSFPVGWLSLFLPRAVAVVLVLLLTLGAIGGVVAVAAPVVVEQGKQLVASIPEVTQKAERWLRRAQRDQTVKQFTSGRDVAGMVRERVPGAVERVATLTLPMLGHIVAFLSTLILLLVLAGFLVHQPWRYGQGARALLPRAWEADFDLLWTRLGSGLRNWVGGTLLAMCVMGVLTALALLAVGIEGWFLLGLLTFLGVSVPYLGAVASAVPGLLVALSQSPRHFWLAAGIYVGVHVVEGYLVEPLVMRHAVKVNPALLLFFQALMGALLGVLGLVVAAPLLTLLQITVTTLWIERRLHKRAPGEAQQGGPPPSSEPIPAVH
jgi:predicted PurR-regulated permease PerM